MFQGTYKLKDILKRLHISPKLKYNTLALHARSLSLSRDL
jgi:hypothetical protein